MKKVKAIYISIIVLCTLLFTGIMGWLSVYTTTTILKASALSNLQLHCKTITLQINTSISRVEQLVNAVCADAIVRLDDIDKLKTDAEYVERYSEDLAPLFFELAHDTEEAKSIYLRFNNELIDPNAGVFYVRNNATGNFENSQTTNLSDPGNENIIWYTLPYEKGHAVWTEPYYSNLLGSYVISYAIPIYIDGEFIGVVGMDVDAQYAIDLIESIRIYETGSAALISEGGKVISHKSYNFFDDYIPESREGNSPTRLPDGYNTYDDGIETRVFTKTANNMIAGISVSNDEIYRDAMQLRNKIIAIILVGTICAALLASVIVTRLFNMSEYDQLTGIRNRKGFESAFRALDNRSRESYSLFIFDIDNFKHINDTYGHNVGDHALVNTASLGSKLFKGCVFARWGGDEFIGLLPRENAESMLELFRQVISESYDPSYGSFTISVGLTDLTTTKTLTEISATADSALYKSKSEGKNRISKL